MLWFASNRNALILIAIFWQSIHPIQNCKFNFKFQNPNRRHFGKLPEPRKLRGSKEIFTKTTTLIHVYIDCGSEVRTVHNLNKHDFTDVNISICMYMYYIYCTLTFLPRKKGRSFFSFLPSLISFAFCLFLPSRCIRSLHSESMYLHTE